MAQGEIHFKADLATKSGAGNVTTAEDRKRYTHELGELVCASRERLQLVFAKAAVGGDRGIEFGTECKARREVVLPGESAGVDMAAGGLYAEDAGAGVAGEEKSEVGVDPGFVRERFLRDGVEPVVPESGAKFLAWIAGRKFDVKAGGECGNTQGALRFVEVPLDAGIGVTEAD